MTHPLTLLDLPRYDVDRVRGFVPREDPLTELPAAFAPWDELASRVPAILSAGRFRETIGRLPQLDPSGLADERSAARGLLLLSVFGNAYVWETGTPAQRIPSQVAVPLWQLAERLGRPPIVHHASMVLANWRRLDPAGALELENLDTLVTFRGIPDEKWFYLITLAIELKGAPAIPAILAAQAAVAREDVDGVTAELERIAATIIVCTRVLERMYERCAPAAFFAEIRPWLTGWPEPGVIYEGVSRAPIEAPHRFAGGSAAQSSLIQAFDAALGVAHPSPASGPFLLEMRRYMPPPHRRFLERLEQGPSIAAFVRSEALGVAPLLHKAYEICLDELDRFRKVHLEMAARYITAQAKGDPTAKGTGGTDFGAFLGAARRETQNAKHGESPYRRPVRDHNR